MTKKLDEHVVRKIANLARLELSDQEVKQYQEDLGKILAAFETLEAVHVSNPNQQGQRSSLLASTYQGAVESVSHLQKDEINNSIATQDFLATCPDREGVFVRVPAILNSST